MRAIWIFILLAIQVNVLCGQTTVDIGEEIIEPNHYYNPSGKEKSYMIQKIQTNKPLMILLKPPHKENIEYTNKITLTIDFGSTKKECQFKSYHDICAVDNVKSQKGTMKIQCQKTPCEATWKILQPEMKELQNTEHIQRFYKMSEKDERKMHLNIFCTNIEVKDVSNMFEVYSTNQFMKFDNERQSYILFPTPKEGYIFFQMNTDFKDCAALRIDRVPKSISSNIISDLLVVNKQTSYDLSETPDHSFRMDIGLHIIAPSHSKKNTVTVKISAEKSGNRHVLRENQIELQVSGLTFDISYAIPHIPKQYQKIQLQFTTNMDAVLLDFNSGNQAQQLVQAGQLSYFDLKKGQKLSYKLISEEKAPKDQKIKIILFDQTKIKSSKKECDMKSGCQFQIDAIEDARGFIYLGVGDAPPGSAKQIVVFEMGKDNTFTKKIKEGQQIYVKKNVTKDKAFQVLINSGNVMVYMAPTHKCPVPSPECYYEIGTLQRHFVYVPKDDEEKQVIFMIYGLDNTQFTLTLLEEGGSQIKLKDSQPFAYLMDDKQMQLRFIFQRGSKVDVSFNLVGPLHALDLIVENGKQISKNIEDAQVSSQGYLSFKASQTKQNIFSILVKKRESYLKKFVHFMLIASTKGKQIRLQSGITYYETLSKTDKNNAQYVFEFNTEEDYVFNFYSHNVKEEKVNIQLQLSASNDWNDKKSVQLLTIDKASDVLQLNAYSEKLCLEKEGTRTNCELFMKLQNKMDIEIDIALTLMTRQAIIQLHDGVWQSFSLHSVAKSAHFYFEPNHKDQDVSIFFKTTDTNNRLAYRLFAVGADQLNPTQWPFPGSAGDFSQHKKYTPAKHMSISKKQLEMCWPYCLVLMSMIQLEPNTVKEGNFSVMISDSITQIPQKQKFDLVLSADQQKIFLVDLKYALDQDKSVYFYTFHSMGHTGIVADVYSEKNYRIPDEDQADFYLNKQTIIPIEKIKKIIEDQQMDEHKNIYLYIVIKAETDSKLSIQFSFNEQDTDKVKLISYDTFQNVKLNGKESKIFYTLADQPFQLKVVRQSGFPFIATHNCKKKFDECLEEIQDDKQDGKQILTKISANTAVPCQHCFYFFKLSTKQDPASVQIYLQSSLAEIQLAEKKSVYDFTEKQESNKYILYAVRGQQIFINVDIIQGEVSVQVTDLHHISMEKSGKELLSFVIPTQSKSSEEQNRIKQQKKNEQNSKDKDKNKQKQQIDFAQQTLQYLKDKGIASQNYLSAFGLSEKFIVLHVEVKSINQEKQSIYTIGYSSGQREFDLQDGLITDYQLQKDKQSVFYYSSKHRGHAYLIISMDKTEDLKQLKVVLKYCQAKDDVIDEDCWVQIKSDRPPIKDKSPNPTIMYSLPSYNYFSISLEYEGKKQTVKTTLGINHQEIILLPMERQFPFVLHSKQDLVLLSQISNAGNAYITIRKCDESTPTFAYTFDYDSFQKGDFSYEAILSDSPKAQFYTKVTPGTMYIKFSSPEEQSLLSISIKFTQKKTKQTAMMAGGKGQMQYSIIDSTNAEVTLRPPVCVDENCSKKIKYYLMAATKKRDLYTQLVCPSNYFNSYEAISVESIKQEQLTPKQNSDGTLSMVFKLSDQISYVGVKAIDSKGRQVFYKPMQVATLWGQLSRTSHTHKWAIFSVFICAILGLMIFVRRKSRAGYKPIQEQA